MLMAKHTHYRLLIKHPFSLHSITLHGFTPKASGQSPNALIMADVELAVPRCLLVPTIEKMQEKFALIVQNVVETFYAVSTWGKQAKTLERKSRRPLLDEIRYEHNFFTTVNENKETIRIMHTFVETLLKLQPYTDKTLTHLYESHCDLWPDDRTEQIDAFVAADPLTVTIRDKFAEYDDRIARMETEQTITTIGCVVVNMQPAYDAFVAYAKSWKAQLGGRLIAEYKTRLDRIVTFIKEVEFGLSRVLRDLDDVRKAMQCLDQIRENSIE